MSDRVSDPGQDGSKSWLPQVAILTAGGLLGMTALAGVVFLVLSALATNFLIWFLILPYVIGDPVVWTVTIAIFVGIGIGTCFLTYVAVRALVRFVSRRIKEAKNGAQVRTGQP
ncbi:MAG: hypothetical protein KF849_14700 [Rhizobiaceae bacterium]|nr:hypothetical protein [Rhizobiaceae bacterium]